MESLAGILRTWIEKEMSRPDWEKRRLELMQALWPGVVGRSLAQRTKPVAWRADRLRVAVPDAAWRGQMETLAGNVLAAIGRWFPCQMITGLEFVVDKSLRPAVPLAEGNTLAEEVAPCETPGSAAVDLPLEAIGDEELRELVRKIASRFPFRAAS